jgi:hypothetical protein
MRNPPCLLDAIEKKRICNVGGPLLPETCALCSCERYESQSRLPSAGVQQLAMVVQSSVSTSVSLEGGAMPIDCFVHVSLWQEN